MLLGVRGMCTSATPSGQRGLVPDQQESLVLNEKDLVDDNGSKTKTTAHEVTLSAWPSYLLSTVATFAKDMLFG